MPLDASETGFRLTGLIGRPGVGRGTRHEMIVFINQRPVDSRTLSYALIESYHESIPKGRYPLAFVFFACDPAAVDVNVHPAKREVRFRNEPAVRSFVIRAVLQRLRELGDIERSMNDGAFIPASPAPRPAAEMLFRPESRVATTPFVAPAAAVSPRSAAPTIAKSLESAPRLVTSLPFMPAPERAPASAEPEKPREFPLASSWRFVGLAHGSYALFETAAGLVLLDRRAAHERVWFERLQEQFRAGDIPSQRLLLPVPMEVDPIAASMLLDRLSFLNKHGFEISEFGRNFFRVEGIPGWMEPADAEPFLRNLMGAFREGRWPDGKLDLAREELARLAALKAIRLPLVAGDADLRLLVAQLFATQTPLTSPSGRPTYIELNHGELSRRFQK